MLNGSMISLDILKIPAIAKNVQLVVLSLGTCFMMCTPAENHDLSNKQQMQYFKLAIIDLILSFILSSFYCKTKFNYSLSLI